jgi:hypothetical protein
VPVGGRGVKYVFLCLRRQLCCLAEGKKLTITLLKFTAPLFRFRGALPTVNLSHWQVQSESEQHGDQLFALKVNSRTNSLM